MAASSRSLTRSRERGVLGEGFEERRSGGRERLVGFPERPGLPRDGGRLGDRARKIILHKRDEAVGLPAVKPDDGGQVPELLGGKVIDFPSHFSVDVPGIDHEDMIFMIHRLGKSTLTPALSQRKREFRLGKSTLTPALSQREREFGSEFFKCCFWVAQQTFIFDSDDPDALRLEICVALRVFLDPCFVDWAIQLNRGSSFMAVEIQDIVTYLMLAAEFQAQEPLIPHKLPKQLLCRSLLLPQLSRTLDQTH